MASQVHSTSCIVTIETPEGVQFTFRSQDAVKDLLQVQTHNHKAEACGSFTLTFVPRVIDGRTYDELIPMRSVVVITMLDGMGTLSDTDSVVMVGITDDHGIGEDYSRAHQRRVVTIQGRSMAAQFVDGQLMYHPSLEKDEAKAFTLRDTELRQELFWLPHLVDSQLDPRVAIATILRYYLGVGAPPPPPQTAATVPQPSGSTLKAFVGQDLIATKMAQNPTLSEADARRQITQELTSDTPSFVEPAQLPGRLPQAGAVAKRLQAQALIAQKMAQNPTLSTLQATNAVAEDLNNGIAQSATAVVTLTPAVASAVPSVPQTPNLTGSKQLVNMQLPGNKTLADLLSANPAEWTLFEEGLTCPVAQHSLFAGSIWNYIHLFVDTLFQEFFTRMESGVCKVLFRPKPFKQTPVTSGTRFVTNDPTCQTVEASPEDEVTVIGLRRQSANVLNDFLVVPLNASTLLNDKSFETLIAPTILTDPTDVSFVGRYGIHPLKHVSPYLSGMPTVPGTPTSQSQPNVVEKCQRWGKIPAAWYGAGAELYAGVFSVRGSAKWNIGHRMLYQAPRGPREGYIEGVDHAYDYQTGHFTSQLWVTRLWYLDGPVDVQTPDEAKGEVEVIEMVSGESREVFDLIPKGP